MLKIFLHFSPANKLRNQPRRTFFALCLLTTAIFCIAAANNMTSGATYYVSAADGNDSNPGSSSQPWKTFARAMPDYVGAGIKVVAGNTVYLRSGSYGSVTINYIPASYTPAPSSWNTKILYKADTGHNPVFTGITISGAYDRWLEFDGVQVINSSYTFALVDIKNSSHIRVKNATIQGSATTGTDCSVWTNIAVKIDWSTGSMQDILIDNCNISHARYGVSIYDDVPTIVISNNNIHWLSSSAITTTGSKHNRIIIEGNIISDHEQCNGDHESGLSIRTYPITARNNIIHWFGTTHCITQYWAVYDGGVTFTGAKTGGTDQSIKLAHVTQVDTGAKGDVYQCSTTDGVSTIQIRRFNETNTFVSGKDIVAEDNSFTLTNVVMTDERPYGGYQDMVYENNLIYDPSNATACNIYDIGDNCTFVNNTIVAYWDLKGSVPTNYRNRYSSALTIKMSPPADCSTFYFYNNIIAGAFGLTTVNDDDWENLKEDYNIIWCCQLSHYSNKFDYKSALTGTNTKICVTSSNGLADGYTATYFETSGGVFVGGDDFDTYGYTLAHGIDLTNSFKLYAGSPAVNSSNTNYAPAADILGNTRDATPDAGCYEYVSGSQSYSLSITAANGSVSKSPNKTSYTLGETVTLQATSNTGYHFSSWSGDVTDTNSTTTITMNSNKSVTANFAINTYTLTVTATNGSVSKTPSKSSYNYGESVSLTATANTGYHFVNWSGDASVTSSTTIVTMNSNKSVTANFAINTYSLTVNASNGSVAKTPSKTSYNYGEQVTLQATPNTGYHFSSWSGSISDTSNPTTITMNANKTVTANFAINTYTLNVTAVFGSVTKTPNKALYNYGDTVSLQAYPKNSNYAFTGWAGDASGNINPLTITMNSDKSVTANFVYTLADNIPPSFDESSCIPRPGATQVPLNTIIVIHIVDTGQGVDANYVSIKVDDSNIYTGNVSSYNSTYGRCRKKGDISDYTYIYQSSQNFDFDQTVTVAVTAKDLAGNLMDDSFSFRTEMLSFGKNQKVNSGTDSFPKGHPASIRDSSGNIWAAWHKGAPGSSDIYIGKLTAGAETFNSSLQLTTDASDQCNPAIAADSTDKLYVVWQDNRRGNWDIYISTSSNGTIWSPASRITDSNANQINPAIAIDRSDKVYVAWQDDQNVNQDIFVAYSTDYFLTKTVAQVTSNTSDQVEPVIVTDAEKTAYIFWTDLGTVSKGIYGAASNNGPWTNFAIVTGDQSEPAVAAEETGTTLHLVWVDNSSGNKDILYAHCSSLQALTGISIIDDSTLADQNAPAITVTGSTGSNLKVFACWQDKRNPDTDIYIVQIGSSNSTNIFVGDDDTGSAQSNPVIGTDKDGYPYLLWVDNRNYSTDIYYAGSTHAQDSLLFQQNVPTTSDVTIGTTPSAMTSLNDIYIIIPAGTYLCDVNVTGAKIENPPKLSLTLLSNPYEFGPSGLTFSQPVTIIIPYTVSGSGTNTAYWFNSLTSAPSQIGITDIQDITISSTLHAVSFKTTHFTWFFVGSGEGSDEGGGGGGGGCSLASPGSGGHFTDLLLPCLAFLFALAAIGWRDRLNQKSVH